MSSPVSFLVKPASSLCNLRCRYCFYEDESENRIQKSYGIMSGETARRLIKSAVKEAGSGGIIYFGFQGGEPTVAGLDFFRRFIEEEKKYPEHIFHNSLQTNGYALNEEWAAFLSENSFLVGISIDGYRDLHDLHRLTPDGGGSFDAVASNLKLLRKYNVETNALCVVTRQCAGKPHRVYNRLKGMGFDFLQFIPCLDPIGTRGLEDYSLLPREYGQFLCAVFDDWYRDWEAGSYVSVRQFEDYVHLLIGETPSSCAAAGICTSYITVEADGSMYPCDFYVLDEWKLGNIYDMDVSRALNSPLALRFRNDRGRRPDECRTCRWFSMCHGGCKRDITGNECPENYYCSSYKFFFEYAADRLRTVAGKEISFRRAHAAEVLSTN